MEQNSTGTSKQCNETRCKKVIEYAKVAHRLSENEEYKPLYEDGNFLELANPDEPHTSKMIAAILNYEQNGEHILFKSFVRRFLSPIGLKEEWIKNPDIQPEKDCMDIRILDEKYAILFESKLKGADFQRNQLGRYIYKLNDKQYNGKKYDEKNIFIVLIPGHISNDFISEIPKSVWKRPQDFDHPICATNGNQTTCLCDEEMTKEKCRVTKNNDCNKYFEQYLPQTIVIDKSFAEWISSATGLVESKQMPLISSMTLFANYIKKLYNINYPDKLIMEIKNYLEKIIFKDGLTTEHKLEIAEHELSNVDAVQEALKSMVAELKVEAWYDRLKIEWSEIIREENYFYIPIKEVKVGYWDGTIDNRNTPYWGFQCLKPQPEQEEMVNKILNELNIKLKDDKSNGFLAWSNWNENDLKGYEICAAIYSKAKELGYLIK